jgi:hypothetical protein
VATFHSTESNGAYLSSYGPNSYYFEVGGFIGHLAKDLQHTIIGSSVIMKNGVRTLSKTSPYPDKSKKTLKRASSTNGWKRFLLDGTIEDINVSGHIINLANGNIE